MSVNPSPPSSGTSGAYDGIRVLDFSMFVAGPYCTRLMADMGAEVIKIEPRAGGDFLRAAPPLRDGYSAYFGQVNCGKKSIALDLKSPDGVEVVERLVQTADVILENFRPGVMKRLGLSYHQMANIKPDIVYCSVSGYGQEGPKANLPSYAPVVHAASGFDMLLPRYDHELERPVANRYVVADVLAAVHALAGIGAALFNRTRTGKGEHLDVALMDTMHNVMAYEYADSQFENTQGPIVFRPMPTRDGFLVIAPVTEANFDALAKAAEHPEWLVDERFTTRTARFGNWSELLDLIEAWTRTVTSADGEAALLAAGCPASAYRTIGEARLDEQVAFRGASVEVVDSVGPYRVPNCPIQFSSASARAVPSVPELGEHADEVLGAIGYETAKLTKLRDDGVLG